AGVLFTFGWIPAELGNMRAKLGITAYIEVQLAIVIHVYETGAGAPVRITIGGGGTDSQTGARCDLRETACAFIMIQGAAVVTTDIDIRLAVVVIVTHRHTAPVAFLSEAGFLGDITELEDSHILIERDAIRADQKNIHQ